MKLTNKQNYDRFQEEKLDNDDFYTDCDSHFCDSIFPFKTYDSKWTDDDNDAFRNIRPTIDYSF